MYLVLQVALQVLTTNAICPLREPLLNSHIRGACHRFVPHGNRVAISLLFEWVGHAHPVVVTCFNWQWPRPYLQSGVPSLRLILSTELSNLFAASRSFLSL